MAVVDASINDTDLGALTKDTLSMQLVNTGHVVIAVVLENKVSSESLDRRLAQEQLAGLPCLDNGLQGTQGLQIVGVSLDGTAPEDVAVEHLQELSTLV